MAPDPFSVGEAAQGTSAVLELIKRPARSFGRRVGMTAEPSIQIGPLMSGALMNESRPAYRGKGYEVVRCVNRQRQDWRSYWLTTQDALHCRATVRVIDALGKQVTRDDAVFCGPAGMLPAAEVTLKLDDDRFHIPLLSTVDDWTEHHVLSGRRLQAGSYLLGARFFNGLHDSERLTPGRYEIWLTVESVNGQPVEWRSNPFVVSEVPASEPDVVFSMPSEQIGSADFYEGLNIQARASRRFTQIENVRLFLRIDDEEFQIHWSLHDGHQPGRPIAMLYPEQETLALIAFRYLSPYAHGCFFLRGAGHPDCYLVDVSYRQHGKPIKRLAVGSHNVTVTAVFGTRRCEARYQIHVPEPHTRPLSIERT